MYWLKQLLLCNWSSSVEVYCINIIYFFKRVGCTLKYNFMSRFLYFGGRVPHRPVEDIAYAVARFFQRGGTFQNYYMVMTCIGSLSCSYNFHEAFPIFSYPAVWIIMFCLLLHQYHGGTNFGHSAGGPLIATSYDYDAPIDEYGKSDIWFSFNFLVLLLMRSILSRDRKKRTKERKPVSVSLTVWLQNQLLKTVDLTVGRQA